MTSNWLENGFEFTIGGKKVAVPVKNYYVEEDGGYVEVLTEDRSKGVAEVKPGAYLVGLLRLRGKYHGSQFVPDGYQPGEDFASAFSFKYGVGAAVEELFGLEGVCGPDTGKYMGLK